jgi:hypothetical protein
MKSKRDSHHEKLLFFMMMMMMMMMIASKEKEEAMREAYLGKTEACLESREPVSEEMKSEAEHEEIRKE